MTVELGRNGCGGRRCGRRQLSPCVACGLQGIGVPAPPPIPCWDCVSPWMPTCWLLTGPPALAEGAACRVGCSLSPPATVLPPRQVLGPAQLTLPESSEDDSASSLPGAQATFSRPLAPRPPVGHLSALPRRIIALVGQDYLVVLLLEFYFLAGAGAQHLLAGIISIVA